MRRHSQIGIRAAYGEVVLEDPQRLASELEALERFRIVRDPSLRQQTEAQAADSRTGSVADWIATLGVSGEILEARGENEKALEAYKEAVKLVESVRATAASETAFADVKRNYRPYEQIVRALIKLQRSDEAFDYLNRAKSKKLQESLRLSSMKSGDKNMQGLLDRANGLETKLQTTNAQLQAEQSKPEIDRDKAKIENLKQVVASTQGEFRKVVEQIKTSNPNYEKFMTVNPKALKETQRSIPPGVMLVQFAPLGEQLYVFLVSKENVKIVIAPIVLRAAPARAPAINAHGAGDFQ